MKVKPHGANSSASLKDKASGGYVLNNNNKTLCVLAMLPFAVIVVFFEVLPIAMTNFRSLISEGGGGLTIDNYTAIFTKKLYRDAVINSMIVAVASSLAGLFISFAFNTPAGPTIVCLNVGFFLFYPYGNQLESFLITIETVCSICYKR